MSVRRIKNINEGVEFNKKTFLQNCKDVRMRLSDLIDDNYYNNMDDLNDDDIDLIESEINDIIGMCRSILSEFNLLDESKKLRESKTVKTESKKVSYYCRGFQYFKINNKYFKVKDGTYPVTLDDAIEVNFDDYNYAKRTGDKDNINYKAESNKKLKESSDYLAVYTKIAGIKRPPSEWGSVADYAEVYLQSTVGNPKTVILAFEGVKGYQNIDVTNKSEIEIIDIVKNTLNEIISDNNVNGKVSISKASIKIFI